MGLIPQVKCSRCDRIYSGLRTRCPYCGARRRKKGKRAADTDNALWKLVIGALLFVVLIAAVIVLLVNSLGGEDQKPNGGTDDKTPSSNTDDSKTDDTGVDSITDDPIDIDVPDDTAPPEDTTPSKPPVEKVIITYFGSERTDVTMSITEKIPFGYATVPENYEAEKVVWETSNDSVFVVLQTGETTAIGSGTAELKVTVDGVSATCIIRVD